MALTKESLGAATMAAGAATKAAGAVTKASVSVHKASDAVGSAKPVVRRIMRDKQTRKALAEAFASGRRAYARVGTDPKEAARTTLSDPAVQRDLAATFAALRLAASRASELAERRRRSRAWIWISGGVIAVLVAVPLISKRMRQPEPEYQPAEETVPAP